jgi:hypothetical protein
VGASLRAFLYAGRRLLLPQGGWLFSGFLV